MIIAKGFKGVTGYIEYSYDVEDSMGFEPCEHDKDTQFESDTFQNLAELLDKVSDKTLEEVRESVGAKRVWVSTITLKGKSEDGETSAELCLYDNREEGRVSTKIENKDIDNRLLVNLQKMKEIVDNTLDQYPIKY